MNQKMKILFDEPYRFYFLLGTVCSVLGIFYWPALMYFVWDNPLPASFHVNILIMGFMWFFIQGFLLTALPRFLQVRPLNAWEFFGTLILSLLLFASLLRSESQLAYILFSLSLLFLFALLLPRFLQRKKNPPLSFIFVPVALLTACASSMILAWGAVGPWQDLARLLLHQGLSFFLLLGIGAFLIPALLGIADFNISEEGVQSPKSDSKQLILMLFLACLFLLSFVLEVFADVFTALLLRACLVTLFIFYPMKLHHGWQERKLGFWSFRCIFIFLAMALWFSLLFEAHFKVALLHISFLASFNLAVYLVASKVILTHAGKGQVFESKRYLPIQSMAFLMVFAMSTRASADFLPRIYLSHLSYAALLWGIALIIWMIYVMPKIFIVKKP